MIDKKKPWMLLQGIDCKELVPFARQHQLHSSEDHLTGKAAKSSESSSKSSGLVSSTISRWEVFPHRESADQPTLARTVGSGADETSRRL